MLSIIKEQKVYWILRVGSAMCFIGHGIFGILTKPIWVNYFAVFGIGHASAYHLMPILGTVDILFGLIILIYPIRVVVMWLVVWGLITALLRPLAGEPFAELIERAGNFGAPLALLVLSAGIEKNRTRFFSPISSDVEVSEQRLNMVKNILSITIFLLFAGHGWLNIIGKKGLIDQYTSLGFSNPIAIAQYIGLFEIIMAFSILIRPMRPLIIGLFIWKISSELLYPHYEVFEWIERGGSYSVLLSLLFVIKEEASLSFVSS